jgi:uncharacterized membrane protein HdeD (DUF308 family)
MDIAITITYWILFLSIIASFVVSLNYREKKDLIPIQLYIIVSFVVNGILNIIEIFSIRKQNGEFESALVNIYSLLEISIFYYYLFKKIKRQNFHISMIILLIAYYSICVILWTTKVKGIFSFTPNLFGFEGILIIIPCFFYLYEILKSDFIIDLKSNANFIIICGILFYFGITIPSYFSWYNLYFISPKSVKIIIITNYIFYTFLFISFIKAYLCIAPEQK